MKNRFLFLLLFCCCHTVLFAQNNKQVDSLLSVLKIAKEDTGKVNTLNALADEFINNNPDTAIYFGSEALALATKLNYQLGIADGHWNIGIAERCLGNFEDALQSSNDALKLYNQLLSSGQTKDKSQLLQRKASIYNNIGTIHGMQSNYPESLKNFLDALSIREEIGDKEGIAGCYNGIGILYYLQGDYPEALKNYFASLKIWEELGNKKGIADSYDNIGNTYCNQGNYSEALKNHFASLKISEELRDKKGIAANYSNIGIIYADQGNYPDALKNFSAASKIYEELGDKQNISANYNNIGIIYRNQGNYTEALTNYFIALRIDEEIGDKRGIAYDYNNIGIIYESQRNDTEALKNYFASLKIKEEIGDKQGIASEYGNIGNIYKNQGNYPEALKNFFAALKIDKEIGDKKVIASIYNGIGNVYYDQGNYHEALKNYFASLKIREEIGDKHGITSSCINIGNVFSKQAAFENTPAAEEKYNEAREYLNKGLLLSKEVGIKEGIMDSNKGLAELDRAQGNFAQALEHYKSYILYKDSILNEESNNEISRLKIQFETEKKDQEIELLSKENEIKALQVKQEHTSMLASKLETEKKQNEIVLLNTTKELQDLELKKQKDELEKKQLEAEVKNKEVILLAQKSEIQQASIQRQQLIRNSVIIFCLVVFVFAGLLFNRFKLKKKIESQQALLNERKRISTELHDDLGAQLSTARMFINNLKNNMGADGNHRLIENSLNLIDSSISDLRKIMDDLQSSTLQEKGYVAATEELVNKINQLQQINFALTHHGIDSRFDHKTEHNLFRITQELINNTLKYAKAKNVSLDLVKRDDKIVLMYEDDGEGFDVQNVKHGYGLSNIESRAQALAGTAEFDSKPGAGSRTIIEMPLVYV
ncbi:MAG TPA: tetratricopeptide repeat protein [Chitinophagales bacterium]|nr:tetratricopeptide repeat protein [Chitinophagales bacterium]